MLLWGEYSLMKLTEILNLTSGGHSSYRRAIKANWAGNKELKFRFNKLKKDWIMSNARTDTRLLQEILWYP
jgi:hypothetical protein